MNRFTISIGFFTCAFVGLAMFFAPVPAQAQEPGVRYEQRNGQNLPLKTTFFDERGVSHPIGDYFGTRPVVIIFGYFRCNQLCSVVSDATIDTLRQVRPEKVSGFNLLYLSIDSTDTVMAAAEAKTRDVRRFGRAGAEDEWHYLTGQEMQIKQIAQAAGFVYRYDPPSRQYAHPSGFLIATPAGAISSYFLGVDFPAQDVATALRRASQGETGPSVFDLLLLCFHGEGIAGRYGPLIWKVLQFAVAATVLGLATMIGYLLKAEKNRRVAGEAAP